VTVSYSDGNASVSGAGSLFCGGCEPPQQPVESGDGQVFFYFSVVGSKSETVPLLFTGSVTATSANPSFTGAAASFDFPGGQFTACPPVEPPICVPGGSKVSIFTTYNAVPNSLYFASVTIGASFGRQESIWTTQELQESWNASADMRVQIDPTFADAKDFKLEFSPNPPGVPEPGSLLLLGIALLVLAGFNQKRFRTLFVGSS
jgi:hypothetical protein